MGILDCPNLLKVSHCKSFPIVFHGLCFALPFFFSWRTGRLYLNVRHLFWHERQQKFETGQDRQETENKTRHKESDKTKQTKTRRTRNADQFHLMCPLQAKMITLPSDQDELHQKYWNNCMKITLKSIFLTNSTQIEKNCGRMRFSQGSERHIRWIRVGPGMTSCRCLRHIILKTSRQLLCADYSLPLAF